jgi:hypothetical protein
VLDAWLANAAGEQVAETYDPPVGPLVSLTFAGSENTHPPLAVETSQDGNGTGTRGAAFAGDIVFSMDTNVRRTHPTTIGFIDIFLLFKPVV